MKKTVTKAVAIAATLTIFPHASHPELPDNEEHLVQLVAEPPAPTPHAPEPLPSGFWQYLITSAAATGTTESSTINPGAYFNLDDFIPWDKLK